MANEILSKGTKLSYKKSSTFEEVVGLLEIPEMGSTKEKVEVTDLSDANKRYISGVGDYGDLAFKFNYDNSAVTSNYRILKGLEDSASMTDWKIDFPDGTSFAFSGQVSVKIDSAAVNASLKFTASITLNSSIDVTNPVTI